MDIFQVFKKVFIVLSILTFMFLISSAYRLYQTNARLAALGDAASGIATELALDELAFEDQAGHHAYVVDVAKCSGVKNFTRSLGGDNYQFYFEVGYKKGGEEVLGPFGEKPPAGVETVPLLLPIAVYQDARLLEGRLRVVTWRA